MEQQKTKKYEQYGVPQSITLEDFKYTYKGNLKDEKNGDWAKIIIFCSLEKISRKESPSSSFRFDLSIYDKSLSDSLFLK